MTPHRSRDDDTRPERPTSDATDDHHDPVHRTGSLPQRLALPLTGIAAFVLTIAGLAGVGDAPHPNQSATAIVDHFQHVSDAVLTSAPLGQLGAAAIAGFVLGLARRLHVAGATTAAGWTAVGGLIAVGYLLVLHVVYASIAYEVASASAETTKALFVGTILAVPVVGLGIAVALGGAAYGNATRRLLPAWWTVITATGAVLASLATVSYTDSGFLSPDVQQQIVTNVLLLWLLITATTLGAQPATAEARHTESTMMSTRWRPGSARSGL